MLPAPNALFAARSACCRMFSYVQCYISDFARAPEVIKIYKTERRCIRVIPLNEQRDLSVMWRRVFAVRWEFVFMVFWTVGQIYRALHQWAAWGVFKKTGGNCRDRLIEKSDEYSKSCSISEGSLPNIWLKFKKTNTKINDVLYVYKC